MHLRDTCLLWIPLLALAACSSTSKIRQPYKPSRQQANKVQVRKLEQAERLWKLEDAGFAAARDEVLADPVTAAWWTRTLIGYAVLSYQQYVRRQRDILGTIKVSEPLGYKKALAELRVVGSAGVLIVVDELLRNPRKENRDMGIRILAYMGTNIIPDLERFLQHPDKQVRYQVVQVLGDMARDERARKLLAVQSRNPDYAVRAYALSGLANAGPDSLPLLHRAVLEDPDTFVRRQVVRALGKFKDRRTAAVVLTYLKDAIRKQDRQGMRAAQRTLQRISGIKGEHSWRFWQAFVENMPAGRGGERR